MRLNLDKPSVRLDMLPNMGAAQSTGFTGALAAAYPKTFAKNTAAVTALRTYTGAEKVGLLPEIPSQPFTVDMVDSALALVEGAPEAVEAVADGMSGVVGIAAEQIGDVLKDTALPVLMDTVGAVVQPLVGAIPVVGGFINAAISLFRLALDRRKSPQPTPPKEWVAPEAQPGNDIALANAVLDTASLDLTAYFMPPRMDMIDGPNVGRRPPAERVIYLRHLEGDRRFQLSTYERLGAASLEWTGGFVPGTGTSGLGGTPAFLHDSLIIDKDARVNNDGTVSGVFDSGDYYATARSAMLQTWGSVCSPTPSIWTVDADAVQAAWYNYVRYLRDFLHKDDSTIAADTLSPDQRRAVDVYLAMRLISPSGGRQNRPTLNETDEYLFNNCVPVKAARRLMMQQAWAQSHRSGLILMADPLYRTADEQWGAFRGQSAGSTILFNEYLRTRNDWMNRHRQVVCQFKPEDVPEGNRVYVENYLDAHCSRVRDTTGIIRHGGRGPGQDDSIDGEGWQSGRDEDKNAQDPTPGVAAAGNGLAALIAIGLLGGTLMLGKR